MIVYGASGHGKVIIDIIKARKMEISAVVDDNAAISEIAGLKVDHKIPDNDATIVIAIGNNNIRKKVADQIPNILAKPLIHPQAIVGNDVQIGDGSVIMANAVVNPSTTIGKNCILNTASVVEHDVQIEDFVHISPGSVITGGIKIGEGTQVGAGATVIPGITIGKWVTIGAGAVVINDIPDFAVVVGNPAKIIKFNKTNNE